MEAKPSNDLMELDAIVSLARQPFTQGEINLAECNIASMQISEDYRTLAVNVATGSIKEMEGLMNFLQYETGIDFSALKLYTPVYESILNAFQHGNRRDSTKAIRVHYRRTDEMVEIMVEDEGGTLNPSFVPYVLRHHDERYMNKPIDFYTFCGVEKPETNLGNGTFFIHNGPDDVTYHKSQKNGLIVRMVKKLDKTNN